MYRNNIINDNYVKMEYSQEAFNLITRRGMFPNVYSFMNNPTPYIKIDFRINYRIISTALCYRQRNVFKFVGHELLAQDLLLDFIRLTNYVRDKIGFPLNEEEIKQLDVEELYNKKGNN